MKASVSPPLPTATVNFPSSDPVFIQNVRNSVSLAMPAVCVDKQYSAKLVLHIKYHIRQIGTWCRGGLSQQFCVCFSSMIMDIVLVEPPISISYPSQPSQGDRRTKGFFPLNWNSIKLSPRKTFSSLNFYYFKGSLKVKKFDPSLFSPTRPMTACHPTC